MVVGASLLACRPEASALNGALVGLGSRIGQEHRLSPGAGAEFFGQAGARLVVVKVRCVLEFVQLFLHGGTPTLVTVAEGIDGNTGGKVDVLLAVSVVDDGAFAMGEFHVKAVIGTGDVLPVDLFKTCHGWPPYRRRP